MTTATQIAHIQKILTIRLWPHEPEFTWLWSVVATLWRQTLLNFQSLAYSQRGVSN